MLLVSKGMLLLLASIFSKLESVEAPGTLNQAGLVEFLTVVSLVAHVYPQQYLHNQIRLALMQQ